MQPSAPQAMPQPPQLAELVCVLTQLPLQALGVLPEQAQVPPTHVPTEQLFACTLQA